jgi:hypothetical protein
VTGSDPTEAPYLDKVRKLAGQRDLGVGVHMVVVEHEKNCTFHRKGKCICNPKVTLRENMS